MPRMLLRGIAERPGKGDEGWWARLGTNPTLSRDEITHFARDRLHYKCALGQYHYNPWSIAEWEGDPGALAGCCVRRQLRLMPVQSLNFMVAIICSKSAVSLSRNGSISVIISCGIPRALTA
jgi:hypothetical protein